VERRKGCPSGWEEEKREKNDVKEREKTPRFMKEGRCIKQVKKKHKGGENKEEEHIAIFGAFCQKRRKKKGGNRLPQQRKSRKKAYFLVRPVGKEEAEDREKKRKKEKESPETWNILNRRGRKEKRKVSLA